MNINKYLCFSLVFAVSLFVASTARAIVAPIPTSLTISDPFITEGESFDVTVAVDGSSLAIPALSEILSFAFDVDPFATLTNIAFTGATVAAGFLPDPVPFDVAGSAFPGIDITSGPVDLATLHFSALTAGADSLHVLGLFDGLFGGAFVVEPFPPFGTFDYDIEAMLDIEVHPRSIPDSAGSAHLAVLAALTIAACRRFFRTT